MDETLFIRVSPLVGWDMWGVEKAPQNVGKWDVFRKFGGLFFPGGVEGGQNQ